MLTASSSDESNGDSIEKSLAKYNEFVTNSIVHEKGARLCIDKQYLQNFISSNDESDILKKWEF